MVKVKLLAPVLVIVRTPLSSVIGMPPSAETNPAISTGSPVSSHEGSAVVVVTVTSFWVLITANVFDPASAVAKGVMSLK